jgi:antitoxin component YwqK of YwqJK toxin-antitoxin module
LVCTGNKRIETEFNKRNMKAKLFIISVILIFVQSLVVANTRPKKDYEVIIKTGEGNVRAWVSGKNSKIRLKDDRVYCGYFLNGLFCKQGELEGKPLNGKYCRYDLKENILESGNYKYGLKEGLWKNLSSGGALIETNEYHKGAINGERVVFINGKPNTIEKFKNGIPIGKTKFLNPHSEKGKGKDKSSLIKKLLRGLTKLLPHRHRLR